MSRQRNGYSFYFFVFLWFPSKSPVKLNEWSLLTTYYLLLTAYRLLLTAYRLLLTAYYLPLTKMCESCNIFQNLCNYLRLHTDYFYFLKLHTPGVLKIHFNNCQNLFSSNFVIAYRYAIILNHLFSENKIRINKLLCWACRSI